MEHSIYNNKSNWIPQNFEAFQDLDEDARQMILDAMDPDLRQQFMKSMVSYINNTIDVSILGPENDDLTGLLKSIRPEDEYSLDDKGNGALYADIFYKSRWSITAGEWFYYDGRIWREDSGGMIASRNAKQLSESLLKYGVSICDDEKRIRYMKHILRMGNLNTRKRMIEDARDKNFLSADMMDTDKYVLNVQNGVIDLNKHKLLQHSPDQMLSKICNVKYDPDAPGTRWKQFLDEIFQGDQQKIDYVQRIVGYSLTGDTKEEACYIFYGQTTRNGKSTFTETISYMLGDYAMSMRPETLAQRRDNDSRRASSDIARLNGCRFLNASEPPKRMIFDSALLKTLLGRDAITARFLHQNEFQFIPCFKLFINTNYLPTVSDTTLFTSGRLNVITFDRHFSPEEQDKTLKDQLRDPYELSGILNWCLEGLRKYQESGAEPPQCVIDATKDYEKNSDRIGLFMDECMVRDPKHNTAAGKVFELYEEWCSENGYGSGHKHDFFEDLKVRNIFSEHGTVAGKTIRKVVKGYVPITSSFQKTDEEFPEKITSFPDVNNTQRKEVIGR